MEPEGPKLYDITAIRMAQDEHDTTLREMAPEEIDDIERGFPSRKLNELGGLLSFPLRPLSLFVYFCCFLHFVFTLFRYFF